MVKEIKRRHLVKKYLEKTRSQSAFSLYPNIDDRMAYEGLDGGLKKELVSEGERAMEEPWSVIHLSDYLEFSENGNRQRFEELYFSRRRKLCSLVMAELSEDKGRFLKDILDGIYLILEESSWCLPAHNTHVRDARQQVFPDTAAPVVDLFAAETGALIAFAEYLLRPVFEKKSPLIAKSIDKALTERIFTPYRTEHFWWMGDGKQDMCNWTPWCTQNVLICALTRREGFFDREQIRWFLENAALSLDYFMDEYGDDGACSEGAQYYSHAGLCLFGALYIMKDVLGEEFGDVFKEELVRNMAAFIVRMNVRENVYINFADCAAICPRRTAREFLFGKLCGDEALASFAASNFRDGSICEKLITDEINLFYHVLQSFCYGEMERYEGKNRAPSDFFFGSTGLMVSRDERFLLAAKAGNNADSHNHNDVGSFTVYKEGKPFIIDLGVGTYTRQTFSDRRYELWTMQSQFHNLPTFIKNDTEMKTKRLGRNAGEDYHDNEVIMQKAGQAFAAGDVACKLSGAEGEALGSCGADFREAFGAEGEAFAELSMDIAGAYDDLLVRSYRRRVGLVKGRGVEVIDEYDGDAAALLTLMTYEKPLAGDVDSSSFSGGEDGGEKEALARIYPRDRNIEFTVGNLGRVKISGAKWATVQTFPIEDERLKISWKHEVYRILIRMDEGHRVSMSIE